MAEPTKRQKQVVIGRRGDEFVILGDRPDSDQERVREVKRSSESVRDFVRWASDVLDNRVWPPKSATKEN